MKKILASVLCAALAIAMQPISLVAAGGAAQGTGSIAGTATENGVAKSGVRVRLRNVDTGQLAGNTTSAANGSFSFTGLPAGNFVIETLNAAGQVIGTSTVMAVAAGAVITGVVVSASAAGALAGAAAAGGLSAFFTSTGGLLVLAGAGIGATAGIIAATGDASPSQ